MKQCPKCNASISDTAKFCTKCGTNIKKFEEENSTGSFCPECGTRVTQGEFCPECGYKIGESKGTTQSESDDIFGDAWLSGIASSLDVDVKKQKTEKEMSAFEYEEIDEGVFVITGLKRRMLSKIVVPDCVEGIDSGAFAECIAMEVKLPEGLTWIGDRAFADCVELEKINFPASLRRIGDEAFSGCENLEYVISNRVRVGKNSFLGSLTEKKQKLQEIEKEKWHVGNTVKFGKYKYHADGKTEEIEWLILAVEPNKALLISKHIFEFQPYHSNYADATWETCALRKFLNGHFYNIAFTKAEQQKILSVLVPTDNTIIWNPEDLDGDLPPSYGNETRDKLFLLSYEESRKFFENNAERRCDPTPYVKKCHRDSINCDDDWYLRRYGNSPDIDWWLRTPGMDQKSSLYVLDGHYDDMSGADVNDPCGVRPALWIDLKLSHI